MKNKQKALSREQERILRAQERAEGNPPPHLVSFSIPELVESIRKQHFPKLEDTIAWYFVMRGPLACIRRRENDGGVCIFVHQILNHADTPVEVMSYVIKHQLLHTEVPRWAVSWWSDAHPPMFWDWEKKACPERDRAWDWIWANLSSWLKRPRKGRMTVRPNWKESWEQTRWTLEECEKIAHHHGGANLGGTGW